MKCNCGCNSEVLGSYARCPIHSPDKSMYPKSEAKEVKRAEEIPETILRKHIASMKITNKLWDAIIEAMEEYANQFKPK